MGLLANDTNTPTTTKTYNNEKAIYIQIDGQDKSAQFKPSKAFEDIVSNEDVLKIITKSTMKATKANQSGYVNFEFNNGTKQFGFLNFLTNSLNAESSEDEKIAVLFEVEAKLSKVTLEDISRPVTAEEARSMLDAL